MTINRTPPLQDHILIDAPIARVWEVVSDVRRMAEWSPQVDACEFDDGHAPGAVGARFTNHNRHGDLRWRTHGEIVRSWPGQELAFRIDENTVVWVLRLDEVSATATRLTQARETPDGISEFALGRVEKYLGGQDAFAETMRANVRATLAAIRSTVEGMACPPSDRHTNLTRSRVCQSLAHG